MTTKGKPNAVEWKSKVVAFSKIILDSDKQRAYYFDLDNSSLADQKGIAREEFLEWYKNERKGKTNLETSSGFYETFKSRVMQFQNMV